ERYITDTAWERGWVPPIKPVRELAQSIGIIGAGPAGLSAADQLRSGGYQGTIYDRHDRARGLPIYGIPNFKLEKEVVERRTKRLADGGVTFKLGVDVGKDITLAQLRNQHDAILVATGVYKSKELGTPGQDAKGVFPALDYLIAANRVGL